MRYFFNRLYHRIIWSWAGIRHAWRAEHSFRTWVWANLVSVVFVFALPLTLAERALILSLGMLVLAFELVNTAIELVVDYISEDHHHMAKGAKDCGSAAVFVSSLAAGVAWIVVLVRLIWG